MAIKAIPYYQVLKLWSECERNTTHADLPFLAAVHGERGPSSKLSPPARTTLYISGSLHIVTVGTLCPQAVTFSSNGGDSLDTK